MKKHFISTPLGDMVAIADRQFLYLLQFVENFEQYYQNRDLFRDCDTMGEREPICQVEQELKAYFEGKLISFETPIQLMGTPFQQSVWQALKKIPFGKTASYLTIAQEIAKPTASRAIGGANRANPVAIIFPCHRVIRANQELGGYAGGVFRKQWLLEHEHKIFGGNNERSDIKRKACASHGQICETG